MSGELRFFFANKCLASLEPEVGREYIAGSDNDCDLVLPASDDVAPRHAKIELVGNQWWIEDLDSPGGTTVNRRAIFRDPLVNSGAVRFGAARELTVKITSDKSFEQRVEKLRQIIYNQLVERLNIQKVQQETLSEEELENRAYEKLREIFEQSRDILDILDAQEKEQLKLEVIQDLLRLGPLEPLIEDDSITEIMVTNHKTIYVERKGKITLTSRHFRDDQHLLTCIERIVAPLGRRIDEASPLVDARLRDGSRVNAVIPPITPDGPCLTIRKFGKNVFTVERLMGYGSLTPDMAEFLRCCVKGRKNIVVSGGTGSGKTSLLNAISMFLPDDERIVTIEDSLELKLQQRHVVRMEARPPNAEGKGEVPIRSLVKNSLRMRPDRIVVGECRGGEALDMLQAMNTGHDGSLTTVHANSPKDAVSRLETLVLMAGMDLPSSAIRDQIFSAVNVIVQTTRLSDGSRKIVSVTEIVGATNDHQPIMNEIFTFKREGVDYANGYKVLGRHEPVNVPTFMKEFEVNGIPMSPEWFKREKA